MPSCVACGSELVPPVRALHAVYVKTLYRIVGYTELCTQHDAEPSALRAQEWRLRLLTTHTSTAVVDDAVPRVSLGLPKLYCPSRPPHHWTAARTCARIRCC